MWRENLFRPKGQTYVLICQVDTHTHTGTRWVCALFLDLDGSSVELKESHPDNPAKTMLLRCDRCLSELVLV